VEEKNIMTQKIRFGTDGWRAIIADEFTFKNVCIVSTAIGNYVSGSNNLKKKGIIIGYDNRFLSEEFARQAGSTLSGQGLKVYISKESIPTPVIAFMVIELKLDGAIMITASHNPPKYNGIKFIPYY
jgi:phosphomannomutase